ncbi:ABC transporter substrate-binding protein [Sphaerisporangium krabiense]|uniref:NitT/TauT family transport system substrate-binding protein n=1 Tax=Sphaerisporangium krabiense TaxID=763782 RepID=A0A7W9DSX6_9ACTN|nr:ABC transporter substrate-binding protein [Sphaerisporangium krabiense]MBB5629574.1 NitT/TauT family transport system substrate-binding protein [Sphaerisporangium krabiense]GII67231.1 ABC transporter substrate-binding protein [Sphaerisporangium krabiense]
MSEENPAQEPRKDERLISRRSLLVGGGVAGATLAGAGALAVWAATGNRATEARSAAGRTLRIGYGGGVCEAPLYAAYTQGLFARHGLKVELVKTGGDVIKDAVGSGKLDAAPGILFSWLKPIEQGVDVKLASGLHQGCLRLITKKGGPITDIRQLKGRTIGVAAIGDSAMSFFSLDLLDAGLHPVDDVEWRVYPGDQLGQVLDSGQVQAVAASDPHGFLPQLRGIAAELANNRQGANAQHYCCTTALNGRLLREDPETAARLVRAWSEGSRWVAANPVATARLEVEHKYVAAERSDIERVLASYVFAPSAAGLKGEIGPDVVKFKRTGYLDARTDPKALADKAFADLGLDF